VWRNTQASVPLFPNKQTLVSTGWVDAGAPQLICTKWRKEEKIPFNSGHMLIWTVLITEPLEICTNSHMAWITLYMPYWHIPHWMNHRLRVRDSRPCRRTCCIFAKASRPDQKPIQLNVYQGTLLRRWSGWSMESRKFTSIRQIQRSRIDSGSSSPQTSSWTEISWLKK